MASYLGGGDAMQVGAAPECEIELDLGRVVVTCPSSVPVRTPSSLRKRAQHLCLPPESRVKYTISLAVDKSFNRGDDGICF